MNNQAFHLRTPEIRANCIAYISQLSDPDYVVTIKSANESRSDAQQRLRWVWFTQMAKELAGVGKGRTKKQWNLHYKHKYMKNLLIEQDEDFVQFFDRYEKTCDALRHDEELLQNYQTDFCKI